VGSFLNWFCHCTTLIFHAVVVSSKNFTSCSKKIGADCGVTTTKYSLIEMQDFVGI